MARKIRFPLKMTNDKEVRSIEELRADFDLTAVLGYYADGKLVTWLRDRYLDSEADKIAALDKDSKSFQSDLCAALGVEFSSGSDEADGELDMDYINRRNEKKRILRTITDDEEIIYKVDQVALDQDDLFDIYDEGKREIYLCQGEFEIPLSVTDVTYIGVADPIVTVRVTDNVNFKEKNIKFVNCVYGWDISNTTPLDNVRKAENLFLKGDYQKAVDILENCAKQENPRAILLLCSIYSDYLPNDKKYDYWDEKSKQVLETSNIIKYINFNDKQGIKRCLFVLKKLADKGDSFDMVNYAKGLDCYNDTLSEERVNYYKLSADKENILAMDTLGRCYAWKDDYNEAFKWYKKSAEIGSAYAQNELGDCYYFDHGITKDYVKAVEWFTKAAARGYAPAQYNLGACYRDGDGVTENYAKAAEWFTKAAEQGYEDAQKALEHPNFCNN